MATEKTKPNAKPETRAQHEVLSRLDHDGETYLPGDTVELASSQAKELVALGVVAPAKA